MLKKSVKNTLNVLVCAVLIFQLVGCGTIMYPERKGQKGGKIDAGVAVLDGIGLLFFLIPGIIAFAIDFNNGTIYLPGTFSSLDTNNIKQVKFDPKQSNLAGIERIIQEQTGYGVKLDQSDMRITKLKSTNEMMVQFTQILPEMRDNRIVLIR
ncbi:MAG: hypothetical protein Q7S13_05530 [Candidatus Omnitrophota bacterium]|nr:hypothetical protein [Candidatus Omnitrophota bacterium]